MTTEAAMPLLAQVPSNRQRLFIRYYTGFLMDLVVLGLFAEYWQNVTVDTFTTSLLAAALLQVLLKATVALEHSAASYIKRRGWPAFFRYFVAWLILFGSKFVILEALAQAFGDKLRFGGIWHGIVTLIVLVVVMLVAEEVMVRIFRRLADSPDEATPAT